MEIRVRQRSTTMKRTVNVLSKLNWGTRACAVLVLCATTAIALPAQTLTTLYSFCPQSDCADGGSPLAGLVQATNGDLYGTTASGGASGNGTVFKITPGGTLTTVHSFCSQTNCTDGADPYAGLVQAANGDLYGTTVEGGADYHGTVFKITPGGTLTTLYSFCSQTNCTDGFYPFGGLVQAANGDFYGTTSNGYGTVFKITPGGTLTTLYSFCSQSFCTDGTEPYARLVQAANGNFYGTTRSGGAKNRGTVFEITPTGTLATLHRFNGTDGATPYAWLVQAADGNLYGTASSGGAIGHGTVFKITPSGTLTTLYSFCSQGVYPNCTDGAAPDAGLVQDTNGDFYGTTSAGGLGGGGTVFRLHVGLAQFFTVRSPSLIPTTIPAGASSGKVQVVTPSGTLSSNASFLVVP